MPIKIMVVAVFFVVGAIAAASPEPFDYGNVRWGMTEQEVIRAIGTPREDGMTGIRSESTYFGHYVVAEYFFTGSLLTSVDIRGDQGIWRYATNELQRLYGNPVEKGANEGSALGGHYVTWKSERSIITAKYLGSWLSHVTYTCNVDLNAIRVQKFSNCSKL